MSVRLDRLNKRLELYYAAEEKILEGDQSWSSPEGITYSRASIYHLQERIEKLEAEIEVLSSNGAAFGASCVSFGGHS